MTTIVKKEDLELKKYYRKVKLDIEEYIDMEEIKRVGFGLDNSVYGDPEGYFKVIDKQEDGYIVKFMSLENLLLRAVIEGNLDSDDSEDFEINKKFAKKIKNQDLDLDEMTDKYAEITFNRIIKEVIKQYKSNGEEGIKLEKKKALLPGDQRVSVGYTIDIENDTRKAYEEFLKKYTIFSRDILTPYSYRDEFDVFYRKIKLNISEYVEKDEAEQLDMNPIYGDPEGYLMIKKVYNPNEEQFGEPYLGYIVQFLNLKKLIEAGVVRPKGNGQIDRKIYYNNLQLVSEKRVELKDLDERYIRIGFEDLIKEIIEQYKSDGEEGINMDSSGKTYLDDYNKTRTLREIAKDMRKTRDYTYVLYHDAHLNNIKEFTEDKKVPITDKERISKMLEKRVYNLQGNYYPTFDYDREKLYKNYDFNIDVDDLKSMEDILK